MNFNEYQDLAEHTAGQSDTKERYCNFGLGIAGEAGEVADYIKKVIYHEHQLDINKLNKELGDVLWYIATIASTAGLTLEEVAIVNIKKLKERYPEGFSPEASKNRLENCKHLHTESTHPYGWIACEDCGKLL